jgi:hypothetical protein
MTLLRRRPREVYRVYAADEFLDGSGSGELLEPATSAIGERRLGRLAGAAVLAGAVGAAGAVLAVNSLLSARGAPRKARGNSRASARPYLARQAAGRRASFAARRARTSPGIPQRGGHGDGAGRSHAGGTPARTSVESGIGSVVARSTVAGRSIASASADAPPAEHVEFGFER